MSEKWKTDFKRWYDTLLNVIKVSGFPVSGVYFYPYDEVSRTNFTDFTLFAEWAKTTIPNFRLFAAFFTSSIIPHTEDFFTLTLLDIAQIATLDPIVLPNLPVKHGEIWIYENNGNSTSQSPYKHYRLMAWDAYFDKYYRYWILELYRGRTKKISNRPFHKFSYGLWGSL